jgi:hypothetical protein
MTAIDRGATHQGGEAAQGLLSRWRGDGRGVVAWRSNKPVQPTRHLSEPPIKQTEMGA